MLPRLNLPRLKVNIAGFLADPQLRALFGRPLFWNIVSFIVGLAMGGFLRLSLTTAIVFFILSLFLFIPIFRKKFWPLLLIISFTLGLAWGRIDWNANAGIGVAPGESVVITGMVTQTALPDEDGFYRFTVKPREVNGEKGKYGEVLVYAGDGGQVRYGQYVMVSGTVMEPAHYANDFAFDYGAYLKRRGIVAVVGAARLG